MEALNSNFKKSKFGTIPNTWVEKTIGRFAKTSSGGTPKRDNKEYYEGGTINWFKTGELVSKFIYDSEEKITEKALNESSAKLFPEGTLLVAMYGATIGKLSILKKESTTNQACCAILPNKNYDTEYLYYQLSFLKNKLINRGAGGAQPNISQDIIKTFPVPLPETNEQQKIASILSTWDKAIELKEKLIEQKKEQKKGLMQKLLTGEVRLPGFKEKWEKKKVGDLITESKEVAKNPSLDKRITVRLNLMGVQKREVSAIEKEGATTQYVRRAGQFIYGKQNLHKGALGLVPKELDGYQSSSDIPSFDFKKGICGLWFYYYFSRESFYTNLERIATGTGSKRIHPNDLFMVKIFVPPFEEQKKISEVLKCMDEEILFYQKELENLKQQKKGLMQLLLTGKVRVKV